MDVSSYARNFELAAKDLYTKSLLFPESFTAKVPGPLPISSATAALRDNFSITPNTSGKFLLIIDVFSKICKLYTQNDLDGTGAGTVTQKTWDMNSNIIDQYRLVSAGCIIRYFGNFNQMAGLFVSAVTSDPSGNVDFRNFQNIEDLTNKFVSKCVDGVKLIYTPMDNRAVEFRPIDTWTNDNHPCKGQYLFVVYGDLFPNTNCIRIDFFRNYEFTTLPAYREYIRQSKSIPCNYELPYVESQTSIAPANSNFSNRSDNNVDYNLKILNYLNSKGHNIDAKMLT